MQRMNPTNGHDLPYWWSGALGLFSLLSLQDYVFILGAIISAVFTIKTYYAKRREEREQLNEEKKRTQIIEKYLDEVARKPGSDRPTSAEVVTEAMKRIASEVAE